MTPEQRSKQASANSNAKRIVWQREAIRAKGMVAQQAAAIDNMGKEIARLSDVLLKRSDELQAIQKECRMMRHLSEARKRYCDVLIESWMFMIAESAIAAEDAAERREP